MPEGELLCWNAQGGERLGGGKGLSVLMDLDENQLQGKRKIRTGTDGPVAGGGSAGLCWDSASFRY